MRNTLLALCVIGIPVILIYLAYIYLPQMINDDPANQVLNQEFQTLSTSPDGQVHVNSRRTVEQQSPKTEDYFYKDLKIQEITNKNTEFYNVVADTPLELEEAIKKVAPMNENTKQQSITKVAYSIDWTLDTVQTETTCEFYGATVITNITMTVPRWVGIGLQTEEIQNQWNEYLQNVTSYENRHNSIMEGISHRIAEGMRFIPKQVLCEDLIQHVNELGKEGLGKAKNVVKRYQSETGGGRLLGVQLPKFTNGGQLIVTPAEDSPAPVLNDSVPTTNTIESDANKTTTANATSAQAEENKADAKEVVATTNKEEDKKNDSKSAPEQNTSTETNSTEVKKSASDAKTDTKSTTVQKGDAKPVAEAKNNATTNSAENKKSASDAKTDAKSTTVQKSDTKSVADPKTKTTTNPAEAKKVETKATEAKKVEAKATEAKKEEAKPAEAKK